MLIEALKVINQRIGQLDGFGLLRFQRLQVRHAHLIGDNLHGHRQVERAVVRVRGNRDVVVTLLQLFIGQPNALAAKHQRYRRLLALCDAFQPAFTRVKHRPRQRTRTGAGADDQATAGNSFIKGINNFGIANHIAGTGG